MDNLISNLLALPDKTAVEQLNGKITAIYDHDPSKGKGGMQDIYIQDDSVEKHVKVSVWGQTPISKQNKGQEVTFYSYRGKQGLTGVRINDWNGKKSFSVSVAPEFQVQKDAAQKQQEMYPKSASPAQAQAAAPIKQFVSKDREITITAYLKSIIESQLQSEHWEAALNKALEIHDKKASSAAPKPMVKREPPQQPEPQSNVVKGEFPGSHHGDAYDHTEDDDGEIPF